MFIAIEGTDAAGKNTQTKLLAGRLERSGYQTEKFSFPRYETALGKAILKHLKNEIQVINFPLNGKADEDALIFQCLMAADKYTAAVEIRNHLRHGHFVVTDRWWQSAVMYGSADGLSANWLHQVHQMLPVSDLNIFLDLSPEEALKRRPEARDRYEKDREKQVRVHKLYKDYWEHIDSADWPTVDASKTVEEVHESIWRSVCTTMNTKKLNRSGF